MSLRILVAAVGVTLGAPPLTGQHDFYNLDRGRPSRVTDAYAIERFAFEASLGVGVYRDIATFEPELAWAPLGDTQLSVHLPFTHDAVGRTEVSLLHNLKTDGRTTPALSLAFDAELGDAPAFRAGALATRSFGMVRVHVNGALGLRHAADWWAGVAIDRLWFRASTVLVLDVSAEGVTWDADPEWRAGLGLRRQITPLLVADIGTFTTWTSGQDPEFGLSVGLSRLVLVPFLMPRGGAR